MTEKFPGAEKFIPPDARSLKRLREAIQLCRGCDLYRDATQAVFGEGPAKANAAFIGEEPGDVEDRKGHVFVGPAGHLLDRAVAEVGFDRSQLYLTNAVKHFNFKRDERGKRRIHQTPTRAEIVACRPWLVAELNRVKPALIVVLGAVAAQSLLGPDFRVTRSRGEPLPWPDVAADPDDFPAMKGTLVATVHPASVLRADDRQAAYDEFLRDLKVAFNTL